MSTHADITRVGSSSGSEVDSNVNQYDHVDESVDVSKMEVGNHAHPGPGTRERDVGDSIMRPTVDVRANTKSGRRPTPSIVFLISLDV